MYHPRMAEPREWEIGQHQLHFEPPDILWVKHRGPVSLEEAIRMVAVARELGASRPFFLVGDLKEAGLPELEAGRYFSEHLRFEWLLGSLYTGTRLAQRAAIKGILLAAYLAELTDERSMQRVHFVSTKDEVLERIVQLRAAAEQPPP